MPNTAFRRMAPALDRSGLITRTFEMSEAVEQFVSTARAFFYEVALSGHPCPACGSRLAMTGESRCRCETCGQESDPTCAFQRCPACGGKPRLRVRRYECEACGTDVPSRFVFDRLVFDVEYFRQKMEEHRQRTAERLERVREMLAASRSPAIAAGPLDLTNHAGLLDALDELVDGPPVALQIEPRSRFDLKAYQAHVQANLGTFGRNFDEIPALRSDDRLDRVWRFIAIIFLAHEGRVEVVQEGEEIMVMQRETDREGCEVPGDLEEADGVEGLVG